MAYTKKSAGSSKAVHTAELTTGQLVLAVCTFLIVLLGVFLLGIIVGEYQYKVRETKAAPDAAAGPADTAKGEGVQPNAYPNVRESTRGPKTVAAAPEAFRSRETPAPASAVVPAPSPRAAEERPAPIVSPPPATPTPEPAAPAAASGQTNAGDTPTTTGPATPGPLEPIEAEDVVPEDADLANNPDAEPEEPTEMLPVEPAKPAPADESKPAPAAQSKPAPKGKFFSVQVAALSDPKNADAIKKKLEKNAAWPVDIEPNAAKKLQVVYVGHFATDAEAEKARREIRKQPEFAEAFVVSRSS
jgi:cell division septation protein DedD